MNKKIIVSVSAIALVTSSLLAFNPAPKMDFHKCQQHKVREMRGDILRLFRELDLSKSQRESIREIMKQSFQKRVNPTDAFTESSFDKQKYIKLSQKRREMQIEQKAEIIEKIYNLLSATQKKDLRTILDMQKIKRKKCQERK